MQSWGRPNAMLHVVGEAGKYLGNIFPALGICQTDELEGKVPYLQCCGHVTATWRAYSDSSYFSNQLSCRKLFHPSYGLFAIIFQSFKHFSEIPGI